MLGPTASLSVTERAALVQAILLYTSACVYCAEATLACKNMVLRAASLLLGQEGP